MFVNAMNINFDDDTVEHWRCPCRDCQGIFKHIKKYYSRTHAIDKGWIFTTDIKYSHDGETVAVCPECAKKQKWLILK